MLLISQRCHMASTAVNGLTHDTCTHTHALYTQCVIAHIIIYIIHLMPTLGITRNGTNVGTSGQTIPYPGEGPREEEQV